MSKSFVLLLNNIRRWRHDLPIIVLIVLGIASGFFAINISDGYIQYRLTSSQGMQYTTVSVYLDQTKLDLGTLSDFIEQEPLGPVNNLVLFTDNENQPLILGWKGNQIERWFSVNSEPFFSAEDMRTSARKVYLSDTLLPAGTKDYSNASFEINGVKHEIIASSSLMRYNFFRGTALSADQRSETGIAIIPYSTYLKSGLSPSLMRIDLKAYRPGDRQRVHETLIKWFGESNVNYPMNYLTSQLSSMIYIYTTAALLSVLSLMGIVALFSYWIETNKPQYRVYLLCGASTWRVRSLILLEWSVISFAALLIAVSVQLLISEPLSTVYVYTNFSPFRIAAIFIGELLITTLLLSPSIRNGATAFSTDLVTGGDIQ